MEYKIFFLLQLPYGMNHRAKHIIFIFEILTSPASYPAMVIFILICSINSIIFAKKIIIAIIVNTMCGFAFFKLYCSKKSFCNNIAQTHPVIAGITAILALFDGTALVNMAIQKTPFNFDWSSLPDGIDKIIGML